MRITKFLLFILVGLIITSKMTANDASIRTNEIIINQEFSRSAEVSMEEITAEASKDPVAFWEKCADELAWFKKWDRALQWDPPIVKWFASGTLNVSYNCLDRHINAGKGSKVALIHLNEQGEKRVVTYQALYEEVNRIANTMHQLGVVRGDRVAIYMPMVPEAIASMLACTRIGAIHTVIFGGIGPVSVKERILDAEVKLLVTADGSYRSGKKINYKSAIDDALDECPCIEKVLVLKNIGSDVKLKEGRDFWYHDLVAKAPASCAPEHMNAEDPLFILYTSGTTGKPKGILHTTGGFLVGVHSTFKWVFDIRPSDTYWCTADIGWITGHSYVVYGPMANAASQVIYEGGFDYPTKNRFAQIIDDNQVSIFYTAPTLVRMFMQWGQECLSNAHLNSLRLLGSIGEPINPEAWEWFHEKIGHGNCPIVDTWFQTETGALVISPIPGITPLKPGSVTKALPGYDVAVLDDEGKPAAKGLLAVLTPYPSMMRGLYNDVDNRFVSTYWSKWGGKYYFAGDAAICDGDGYIWIGGRCDEVLKVSGHRIGTAEIENALIECPDVAESAVVGVKDELRGQKIVAFVVLKDHVEERNSLENELKLCVSSQIGGYARPARIVFVQNLPKTRSGKILRRLLKNLVEGVPVGNVATLNDPSIVGALQIPCFNLYKEFYQPSILLSQISKTPQFDTAPSATPMGSAQIASVISPLLHKHLESTNYDRLHLAEQFIEVFSNQQKGSPEVTPLEAFAAFNPNVSIETYSGGSCYSLTQDLFQQIPKEFNAYTVGSTLPQRFKQPGQAAISHTAVVIPFVNPTDPLDLGCILLDPNFDIEIPIILNKDGSKVKVNVKGKGEWTFLFHKDNILCFTDAINSAIPLEDQAAMTYSLEKYINGFEVGLKPMIAADRKISLLSRNSEGYHKVHLNVNLTNEMILWSIGDVRQAPIPFAEFLDGKEFSDDVANALHLSKDSLNNSLRKIIVNKELLNRLNADYLDLVSNSARKQDFYLEDNK